jgi:hypothetical protein
MWTTENTLQLIEDLHSTPCLWDVLCSEYKDRNKNGDAVSELAGKYVSVAELKKKLHNLKGQFRREQKKLTESKKDVEHRRKSVPGSATNHSCFFCL